MGKAVAGKAGMTMHGNFDETKEYDRLCGVFYNQRLYVSKKKPPIGTLPTDEEFWMLSAEGIPVDDWNALLDGTIPAGNALKLGGKEAEEWESEIENVEKNVESIGNRKNAVIDNNREEIPENDDLNNYLEVGCFYCVAASTIANSPTDIAFTMDVVSGMGIHTEVTKEGGAVIQRILTCSGMEFTRTVSEKDGAIVFGEWTCKLNVVVVDTKPTAGADAPYPDGTVVYPRKQ